MRAAVPGYQEPATADLRTVACMGAPSPKSSAPNVAPRRAAARSAVDAVIDPRKDVVELLELVDDRLLQHQLARERPIEPREARHVVPRALLRVLDRRAGLH